MDSYHAYAEHIGGKNLTGFRVHQNAKASASSLLHSQKRETVYQLYRLKDMTIYDAVDFEFVHTISSGFFRCTSHLPYRVNGHNTHPSSNFQPFAPYHAINSMHAADSQPFHLLIKMPDVLTNLIVNSPFLLRLPHSPQRQSFLSTTFFWLPVSLPLWLHAGVLTCQPTLEIR